jgi:hypothetical protein
MHLFVPVFMMYFSTYRKSIINKTKNCNSAGPKLIRKVCILKCGTPLLAVQYVLRSEDIKTRS